MRARLDLPGLLGRADILWLTFDSLRWDTASHALALGRTPGLATWLGPAGWEKRETPGTFTLPAHWAFFHGFLPTPAPPADPAEDRLMALRYGRSQTTGARTVVFDEENVIAGLAGRGYRTVCVGGVGFFNLQNPLGSLLPGLFDEQVWTPEMGVESRTSPAAQLGWATARVARQPADERLLLFVNVSATHVPHAYYAAEPGARESVATQTAALADVDGHLTPLVEALRRRGPLVCLWMADHGEAYGEDGRWGHRIPHPTVTTVPYAAFSLGGGLIGR